jgi:hypothetical protein
MVAKPSDQRSEGPYKRMALLFACVIQHRTNDSLPLSHDEYLTLRDNITVNGVIAPILVNSASIKSTEIIASKLLKKLPGDRLSGLEYYEKGAWPR